MRSWCLVVEDISHKGVCTDKRVGKLGGRTRQGLTEREGLVVDLSFV